MILPEGEALLKCRAPLLAPDVGEGRSPYGKKPTSDLMSYQEKKTNRGTRSVVLVMKGLHAC